MTAPGRNIIGTVGPVNRIFNLSDVLILLGIGVILYLGISIVQTQIIRGPTIDLSPAALPGYTLLSLGRMTAAYVLSLTFSLIYGYACARSKIAERVLLPLLDVLQSVPILSFLPVVLLALTTILPQGLAVELSAVTLIFTSQAWNLTYSFYQSLRTIPGDLGEAVSIFRFNWWYRFRWLDLPFSAIGLLWNSVMSWAGGWFFLMAAETFQLGERDFRLPGLGSYLKEAANQSDAGAILMGIATLVLVVVLLDQLVWRPLLTWAEKFKLELVENDNPPNSWFFNLTSRSRLTTGLVSLTTSLLTGWLDKRLGQAAHKTVVVRTGITHVIYRGLTLLVGAVVIGLLALGSLEAVRLLITLPASTVGELAGAVVATGLRVFLALAIALAWTIPVGVAIGTNARLAAVLQPVVQVLASIPATALFPVLVLFFISMPLGLDGAAILLMLLGTQWYLLFNIIAGASALPQDLKDIALMFRIGGWQRWRTLILPALFPYIITGLVTAGGGAWNASIVAEYTQFNNETYSVAGLGALINRATEQANYPLLLAATLTMIGVVVSINRLVWRRMYRLAEEKYRLDA